MAELLVPSGKGESAVLRIIDLDLRHNVFVNIVVGLQQIYC